MTAPITSPRRAGVVLAGALAVAAGGTVAAQSPGPEAAGPRDADARAADTFQGYDFGQVVTTMETSVNPLQREMSRSFQVFVETMEDAERLLDEGRTHEAVLEAAAAIDVVLDARDRVLGPMWEGQEVLTEQIALVRTRLAAAVQAAARDTDAKLDAHTEKTLDTIATRIAAEQSPLRKKRLVAHYRTARNLARIRAMAVELSPDQRKMWMNVLHVLDEAALAHQQVMMGSEILFSQFEATSSNLKSYLSLMETVDGASRLIQLVRGADETTAGMTGFAESMVELQQRLAGFNSSVETALEGRMFELEAEIDLVDPVSGRLDGADARERIEADAELNARIARLGQPAPQGDRP